MATKTPAARPAEFITKPSDLPGVVWLGSSQRIEQAHPTLQGPHFPIIAADWEEYEGWSVEEVSLAAVPPSPSDTMAIQSPTPSTDTDGLPAPQMLDAVSPAPAIPAPHWRWSEHSRQQTVGRRWRSAPADSPRVVGESTRRKSIAWPAITERLLIQARPQLAELVEALLGEVTGPRRIVVTSRQPDEGASTTAMVLARWLAQLGRSVLLVDGDTVSASLSRTLGLVGTWNREQSLAAQCSANFSPRIISTECAVGRLDVLPTACRPAAIGASAVRDEELASTVRDRATSFDVVLIDAGPMMPQLTHAVQALALSVDASSPSAVRFPDPSQPDHAWPARLERFVKLADAGLVVRRPQRPAILASPAIEPQLLAWGLRRLVIANIAREMD